MLNYVQPGDTVEIVPNQNVSSGELVQHGRLFGVAATSAARGQRVNLHLTGVYRLPKAPLEIWQQGDLIHWNDEQKLCVFTPTATTILIGVAVLDAPAHAALGAVRLNGSFA
jgi:predicted RecA/RadA family phage recombinase